MKARSARRRNVLPILSTLLILSGGLRITIGAGEALAAESGPAEVEAPEATIEGSPGEDILAAIAAREERLREREALVADRVRALQVAETEVTEQLLALQNAEESLSATIAMAETASETDLTRLSVVYENMAPKDAAALFEQMPPAFAAGFLGMMEPTAAAKIMTALKPETAYSFSVVLAGRNALVPTQ